LRSATAAAIPLKPAPMIATRAVNSVAFIRCLLPDAAVAAACP
jgi:hypothetical protein